MSQKRFPTNIDLAGNAIDHKRKTQFGPLGSPMTTPGVSNYGVNLNEWIPDAYGKGNIAIALPYATEVSSTTEDAVSGKILPVNVTSNVCTVSAPTADLKAGVSFGVCDSRANAGTNNITVDFGSEPFHGAAATDHTVDADRQTCIYTYVNSTIGWVVINE